MLIMAAVGNDRHWFRHNANTGSWLENLFLFWPKREMNILCIVSQALLSLPNLQKKAFFL